MEIAKPEDNRLDLWIFVLDFFFLEEGEGSLHVVFKTLRGLVGQFDRLFKEPNWNFFAGVGGEEESEVGVRALLCEVVQFLLELVEILGHEMHVLEHDPETFFVTSVKFVVGKLILTLTESNGMEHLLGVEAHLPCEELHVFDWIDSR